MSNTDRSIAAEAHRQTMRLRQQTDLLDKTSAYWYACGYNDHRPVHQPYVDPFKFSEFWVAVNAQPSHPSLQDAFKLFERQAFLDRLTGNAPAQVPQ